MGTRQATLSMTYACKLEEDLDEIGTETAMQINPPFEYTTQKTERKNETVAQKPDVKNLIRLKFSCFFLFRKQVEASDTFSSLRTLCWASVSMLFATVSRECCSLGVYTVHRYIAHCILLQTASAAKATITSSLPWMCHCWECPRPLSEPVKAMTLCL